MSTFNPTFTDDAPSRGGTETPPDARGAHDSLASIDGASSSDAGSSNGDAEWVAPAAAAAPTPPAPQEPAASTSAMASVQVSGPKGQSPLPPRRRQ